MKQQGAVKFFNVTKGYGFIQPDAGGRDVFVHISKVPDGIELKENTRVSFNTEEGRKPGKGPEAVNIELV